MPVLFLSYSRLSPTPITITAITAVNRKRSKLPLQFTAALRFPQASIR